MNKHFSESKPLEYLRKERQKSHDDVDSERPPHCLRDDRHNIRSSSAGLTSSTARTRPGRTGASWCERISSPRCLASTCCLTWPRAPTRRSRILTSTRERRQHLEAAVLRAVMLTKDRALDKVQSVWAGEGARAWREMHLQWEPRTKTRLIGMLVHILTNKVGGDIQNGLESWERHNRELESQSE